MQDFLFISFFLGHHSGAQARALLAKFDLLEEATKSPLNRHAWVNGIHFGVNLRLPVQDERLTKLLDKLKYDGVNVFTRFDREYSDKDLDAAKWLVLRTATAGLLGGVDYDQYYEYDEACGTCGAGAKLSPPLIAELSRMGKKDIDHLVYEMHFIVSYKLKNALNDRGVTGIEFMPVKSPRNSISDHFWWLRIANELGPMDTSSTGYTVYESCPSCGRAGHYRNKDMPEVPTYKPFSGDVADFHVTWEYFGNWQQKRHPSHQKPIGGGRDVIVSQKTRKLFQALGITRLVWIPTVFTHTPE
jgi:hypothetical protein